MRLELTDIDGGCFTVDTNRIMGVDNIFDMVSGSRRYSFLYYSEAGKQRRVSESVRDMFAQAYQRGYSDGRADEKRCSADAGKKETEEKPKELKGYMMDEYGAYINVNAIGHFKSVEQDNKSIIEVTSVDTDWFYFDMPIEEFKELVAAKQEEMK